MSTSKYLSIATALSVVVLILTFASVSMLSQPKPSGTELQLTEVTRSDGMATGTIAVTCNNASVKMIAGYVIKIDLLDSSGRQTGTLVHTAVPGPGKAIAPFASWTTEISLPSGSDGKPVRHQLSVDYILFADGSSSGADSERHSLNIKGTILGVRTERMRLKRLLQTRGVQSVADDLNQIPK